MRLVLKGERQCDRKKRRRERRKLLLEGEKKKLVDDLLTLRGEGRRVSIKGTTAGGCREGGKSCLSRRNEGWKTLLYLVTRMKSRDPGREKNDEQNSMVSISPGRKGDLREKNCRAREDLHQAKLWGVYLRHACTYIKKSSGGIDEKGGEASRAPRGASYGGSG